MNHADTHRIAYRRARSLRPSSIAAVAVMLAHLASLAQAQPSTPGAPKSAAFPPTQPAAPASKPDLAIPRDLRDLLTPIRDKASLPALAAVAIKDSKIIAQGCVGLRAAGSPELATIDDKFHLGSCTKSMTATMIARLVDRGLMRWDMTIADAFPDRPGLHDKFRAARLDQLLTNRAGIPHQTPEALWAKLWQRLGSPTEQRLQLLDGTCATAPEQEPGTKFVYANQGFAIAGAMAEKVTGKPWEDLMRDELFAPLAITTAGFGPPGSADTVDQPRAHRGQSPAYTPVPPGNDADNPPAIGPAGTAHMSLPDWARYIALHTRADRALIENKPADDPAFALVSKASMAKLHQAIDGEGAGVKNTDTSGYAMGWMVGSRPWAGGRVLNHSGSNTMWFCVAWIAPKKDFAVLVATNAGIDAAGAADQAAAAIINALLKP
ncbi:MAG: beta-lactamase family protein [Phycisphaerae bacterium]|nr:beta-lactamase family protein [Phycisphaerae bacterium]